MNKHTKRTNEIAKVGTTAIIAGVALAVLEAFEGVVAGSVDMIIDGLSHVTEAGGAVVAVLGAKISGKPADRKHPFGYGRIEYLSALLIAVLTIYAGITGIIGGIESILHPTHPHYSILPLAIVAISMIVRIVVGRHDIHVGEHENSRALLQVGKTELKHSLLSAATLISAAVYMLTHIEINAYIAVIISVTIVVNGVIMLKDMMSSLLGEHTEFELMRAITKTILEEHTVEGVYDLTLNNYGPNRHTGAVHLGVPDTLSMNELDQITRRITKRVNERHHVLLTGVGIYPTNTTDPEVIACRETVCGILEDKPQVKHMHGFYVDEDAKQIRFDVEVGFEVEDTESLKEELESAVATAMNGYSCKVVIEYDLENLE